MESIVGGAIIGVAVSAMLLFNGRVTGISGILGTVINKNIVNKTWRVLFVMGLFMGGVLLRLVYPEAFTFKSSASDIDYVFGGFLVGFGTLLGNGCTSGHGVCGLSRLSVRSLISTITFIIFGIIGLLIFKLVRGDV